MLVNDAAAARSMALVDAARGVHEGMTRGVGVSLDKRVDCVNIDNGKASMSRTSASATELILIALFDAAFNSSCNSLTTGGATNLRRMLNAVSDGAICIGDAPSTSHSGRSVAGRLAADARGLVVGASEGENVGDASAMFIIGSIIGSIIGGNSADIVSCVCGVDRQVWTQVNAEVNGGSGVGSVTRNDEPIRDEPIR